jgi:hypothetical protein
VHTYSDGYITRIYSTKLLSISTDNTQAASALKVSGFAVLENVTDIRDEDLAQHVTGLMRV